MSAPPSANKAWKSWLKVGLFMLGLAAVVWVVRDAGPEQVWATLRNAAWFVPALMFADVLFVLADVMAVRALLGAPLARTIPLRAWASSALLAYPIMIVLPAGRAGGEAARAMVLSKYIEGAQTAATAAHLQACTLLANALISLPCAFAAWRVEGSFGALFWLVAGNGVATLVLGSVLILVARKSTLGSWLAKKIPAFAKHGESFDHHLQADVAYGLAVLWTTVGRLVQTMQYGLALAAVGGAFTLWGSLIAQGIHLVSAGAGDLVPNAVGVAEGMYRAFATQLGFRDGAARAVSVALLMRITQFLLSGVSYAAHLLLQRLEPRRQNATSAE